MSATAHHRQPLAAIDHVHAHAPAERLARPPGKHSRTMRSLTIATFIAAAVSVGRELASRQRRNSHGLEIARLDLRRAGKSDGFGCPSMSKSPWMNILPNGIELIRLADSRPAGTGCDRARRAQTHGCVRARRRGVRAASPHGLHDAVAPARFEARRHRRETHEAVNQQARADQQDERHRDLPGDQQRAQPLALTVAGGALRRRAARGLRRTRPR